MTALVGLELAGRAVLVAGGGPVAARRVAPLVAEGAVVTVVSPALCEDLRDRVAAGEVTWVDREARPEDCDDAWLVHAATSDPRANAAVCRWATARRVFSVSASAVADGTARTPASLQHAGLVVGVASTGPADPARTVVVRDQLAATLQLGQVDLRTRREAVGGGRVVLVGGGPGAADLLTIRGRRALSSGVETESAGVAGTLGCARG